MLVLCHIIFHVWQAVLVMCKFFRGSLKVVDMSLSAPYMLTNGPCHVSSMISLTITRRHTALLHKKMIIINVNESFESFFQNIVSR